MRTLLLTLSALSVASSCGPISPCYFMNARDCAANRNQCMSSVNRTGQFQGCVPIQQTECPAIACAQNCQYGQQLDARGCVTSCMCNPGPICPEVACAIACEFGYQRDPRGCNTCSCNPARDAGSPRVDAGVCAEVACALACEFGYQRDARDCNTCSCNPAPDAGRSPADAGSCGPVCAIYCEYGNVLDAAGCPTCACKPPPSMGACYRGGCSGQLCTDSPNAGSTCEWRAEYACYTSATCARQSNGQCGFTSTPALTACLANPPRP
jgi:hypothetical protein